MDHVAHKDTIPMFQYGWALEFTYYNLFLQALSGADTGFSRGGGQNSKKICI